MVFIKLTAQQKHTWKYSKYDIQAHGLAEAETEKTPVQKEGAHPLQRPLETRTMLLVSFLVSFV